MQEAYTDRIVNFILSGNKDNNYFSLGMVTLHVYAYRMYKSFYCDGEKKSFEAGAIFLNPFPKFQKHKASIRKK